MQLTHAEQSLQLATPRQVDPGQIERELTALWAGLDDNAGDGATVTRAVMSNLLIYCQGEDEARQAAEHIPELVERHPARVIVLAAIDGMDGELDAWVSAHCRRIHHQEQLCAEHIEVRFAPQSIARAASLIRSLLIGDLPTALWWFHNEPPTFQAKLFDALTSMAQQVIYDSVGWAEPTRGIGSMTRWVTALSPNNGKVAFNLAWRRLKPWRRLIAQALAPIHVPGALTGLQRIHVRHGPHRLPVVWLLCAWLASRLEWRLIDAKSSQERIRWRFRSAQGEVSVEIERDANAKSRIESVECGWNADGSNGHVRFHHAGHLLHVDPDHSTLPAMTVPFRHLPIEELIAAQLAHRANDEVFRQAASMAGEMAASLR
ncbi:MAG: glucose-6-phosphate dehydrogenase assembly protein OpcA [Gammaproteobacteria bacterium]|nr:glucose-6-phosphate dehydrogenase assembly protein OpcA [Gammaproteobacteria bacterium]MCP5136909.1 glucose-6-phosphate dehydrogenase assembly protein OpcA [Gammaproteobacteria bacterium]